MAFVVLLAVAALVGIGIYIMGVSEAARAFWRSFSCSKCDALALTFQQTHRRLGNEYFGRIRNDGGYDQRYSQHYALKRFVVDIWVCSECHAVRRHERDHWWQGPLWGTTFLNSSEPANASDGETRSVGAISALEAKTTADVRQFPPHFELLRAQALELKGEPRWSAEERSWMLNRGRSALETPVDLPSLDEVRADRLSRYEQLRAEALTQRGASTWSSEEVAWMAAQGEQSRTSSPNPHHSRHYGSLG